MPDYLVTWTIDIKADTAEAAAREALAIQRDPNSTATVFDTIDDAGETRRVDLTEIYQQKGTI